MTETAVKRGGTVERRLVDVAALVRKTMGAHRDWTTGVEQFAGPLVEQASEDASTESVRHE